MSVYVSVCLGFVSELLNLVLLFTSLTDVCVTRNADVQETLYDVSITVA